MTLVVARQINKDVYIIGDSKFSDNIENTQPESKKYIGGLKVILLTPGLCVGFAGNVENARVAIQCIYDKNINLFDKNCVINYFLSHHKNSLDTGYPTDFIVAVILENEENPRTFINEIFKIADSKVCWENEATHIGSTSAFNSFQDNFHNGKLNNNVPTFEISQQVTNAGFDFNKSLSIAMQAMQGIIDDTSILEVDGIRTVVVSDEGQFKYIEYLQLRGVPTPVNNEPNAPLHFGGAEEGSDHKHVGMFSAVGHGVYPLYWIAGRFGVIYQSETCFEPIIISNCSLDEFRLKVEERISIAHQRALNYQSRF